MSESCKVVFYGELQQGFTIEQVLEAFSEKFGLTKEKASKLFKADREVVLKGGLDEERARKYQAVMEKLGLVVRIDGLEPETSTSTLALEPMDKVDDEATMVMEPSQLAAGLNECPKCGSTNLQNGECQDCGVIVEKYLSMLVRKDTDDEDEWHADPEPENPYNAPEADLVEPVDGELTDPQGMPVGNVFAWLGKGWWHFKQNPFAWMLALVVWIVLAMIVSLLPFIGGILVNLATPVVTAGFFIGCRAQDDGDDFTVGHLFSGFSSNTGQLVLVGVIYLAITILLVLVFMAVFLGFVGMQTMESQDPEMMMSMVTSPGFVIAFLVSFLVFIPIMMSYVFAPVLVALHDLKAWEAMKLSLMGCMKNLLPGIVYVLLGIVLMFIGSIPFGLGLLIVLPILTATIFAAYQDIYFRSS